MTTVEEEDPLIRPSSPVNTTSNARANNTYVAGEDAGRLQTLATSLGLSKARKPLKAWMSETPQRLTDFFLDTTLTSARMHSVGSIGLDERVDPSGTLHLITVRRKTHGAPPSSSMGQPQTNYGTLTDLFHSGAGQISLGSTPLPSSAVQEGDEEEEIIEEEIVEGGSLGAAIFGIVKGTVGPAILYLPHGFEQSGYGIAVPAMLFATLMFVISSFRLLDCWKIESDKNKQLAERLAKTMESLEETPNNKQMGAQPPTSMTTKLLTYPELARRTLGGYAVLVNFGIASMQFGVCLTYLIFVPQNMQEVILSLFGYYVDRLYILIVMVLMEVPLSWVQDIRKLTPTNVLATLLIAYGLCFVLVMACQNGLQPHEDVLVTNAVAGADIAEDMDLDNSASISTFAYNLRHIPLWTNAWFVFVGTSFFMMEGSITLIVPLQEAVFRPEDKKVFPKLNAICTTYIVLFYIAFSLFCCAAFGNGVRTALTASLPSNALSTSIQLAYSIAVVFTFPLQAFPAMEVTCKSFLTKQQLMHAASDKTPFWMLSPRNRLATTVTLGLGVIAYIAKDYLGNVVSILGSLFGIPLALVFPPLMHTIMVPPQHRFWTPAINFTIMGIGFVAMAAASFATIVTWNDTAEGG